MIGDGPNGIGSVSVSKIIRRLVPELVTLVVVVVEAAEFPSLDIELIAGGMPACLSWP